MMMMYSKWLAATAGRTFLVRRNLCFRETLHSLHRPISCTVATLFNNNKFLFTYVVVFCVKLRTFWTPLAYAVVTSSSANRSRSILFTFIDGGHYWILCKQTDLDGDLNLLAMVFENLASTPMTMENFKKLATKCTILHNFDIFLPTIRNRHIIIRYLPFSRMQTTR